MSALEKEKALTLQEVAEILGMSYGTVFSKRHEIGFQLPGSRIWRVWPSRLREFSQNRYQKRNNVTRLELRVTTGDDECQSVNQKIRSSGGSISGRQRAKELDDLLALRTKN